MRSANVEKETKIGMVYSCNDWQTWCGHEKHCGLLIGIYGTKLYYFEKEERINLRRLELVSFIEDEESPNLAKRVLRLEKCVFENEGKKHFDRISWANKKATELFFKSKEYDSITELTDLEIKSEIVRIRKYIDELDIASIIGTFTIKQWGRLQRRVGNDDQFHYSIKRSVDSDDLYINHLLQTGEDSGYYCTNSSENDYDYIDEKATRKCIQVALSLYDKEGHLSFLINKQIKERYEQLFTKAKIKHKLEGLFNYDMVGAALGNHRYIDEFDYEEVVEEFNAKSRMIN